MKRLIALTLVVCALKIAHAGLVMELAGTVDSFDDKKVTLNLEGGKAVVVPREAVQEKFFRPGQRVIAHLTGSMTLTVPGAIPSKTPPPF